MAAGSSFGGPPTLENHFGLNIGNEYVVRVQQSSLGEPEEVTETKWKNPYLGITITPYIPTCNLNLSETGQLGFLNHDVVAVILSKLDLKNIVGSSLVCKTFYFATKTDFVWEAQMGKFLPKVACIAPNLCTMTFEQQFKIIYKRVHNENKPYIAKFERNQKLSFNMLKKLNQVQLQYEKAGGKEACAKLEQKVAQLMLKGMSHAEAYSTLNSAEETTLLSLGRKKIELIVRIRCLSGGDYDGTVESIGQDSVQWKIQNAIKVLVPNAFNDQAKFKEVIRLSEAQLNTNSSNSSVGPVIEDITDIEDRTNENRS